MYSIGLFAFAADEAASEADAIVHASKMWMRTIIIRRIVVMGRVCNDSDHRLDFVVVFTGVYRLCSSARGVGFGGDIVI